MLWAQVSGSAGAPGTTGKMNELPQEAQSKPMAAGNAWCDEQAAWERGFCFLNQATALVGDMDKLSTSLKFPQACIMHPE